MGSQPRATASDCMVIVTARNEAEHIGATLGALALAFPGATLFLADDGSADATAAIARAAGAPGKARASALSVAPSRSASLRAVTMTRQSVAVARWEPKARSPPVSGTAG